MPKLFDVGLQQTRLWLSMLLLSLALLSTTLAECPGACSGHGTCGSYDQCVCFKGFMGGDCNDRICQFGMAHIDTPKGDLDSSDVITDFNTHIITNSIRWPQGTTEQYPNMHDSNGTQYKNTAHEYSECSNKGQCDRKLGQCVCLPGYDGSACQRASCPGAELNVYCNGHGICESARELASHDSNNVYELWDSDVTMGCLCDSGYHGPGCELRKCKYGKDPMFLDAEGSHRYMNISYVIYINDKNAKIAGNYSIEFHDIYNQNWETKPINYDATCLEVIDALESLPNQVIPYASVRCSKWDTYKTIPPSDEPIVFTSGSNYNGIKYTLAFPGNPGKLKPIKILKYLDGKRPTLYSSENATLNTLNIFVYPNGFIGETNEYWNKKCTGVDLTLLHHPGYMIGNDHISEYTYISDLTLLEMRLFQRCLGDADGISNTNDASSRIEGIDYNWDYGSIYNPHIVRFVDTTNPSTIITDLCDRNTDDKIAANSTYGRDTSIPNIDGGRSSKRGRTCSYNEPNPGFYGALYYDTSIQKFRLMNRPGLDYSSTTKFAVWTTTGHSQMVNEKVDIYNQGDRNKDIYTKTLYSTNSTTEYKRSVFNGLIGCEHSKESRFGAFTCLNKGDYAFFLDTVRPDRNPQYMNIYTISKLYVEENAQYQRKQSLSTRNRIELNMAINSNFHDPNGTFSVRAYKFYPPEDLGTQYIRECSGRGLCTSATGLCKCFPQFVGDDCSTLNIFGSPGKLSG
jgi:hypothetical protein